MKTKRLLSGLITVAMLLSLCVTTAFAAGTDYKAGLTVAKVDKDKLSVSLDVGPTGTETKIQGVQSCVVAFDLSVLKPLNKAGNKELTGITTEYSKEKSLSFEDFTDDDDNTWATKVYVYKSTDGATCYYLIQPANGAGSTLTNMVSLAKVYLGFQPGKGYDDVKADTVRFATATELAGKASDKALKFNDGSGSNYAWSNGGTGDTLTFAAGNEPKVVASGFTFASSTPPAPATLTGISVKTAPTKVTYTEGESFDKTGMVIEATYSDSSKKDVTGYTYAPTAALTTSDTTITISYSEGGVTQTCTQTIAVNAVTPPAPVKLTGISVKTAPSKVTYNEGDSFDATGMVIEATYSDSSKKDVTGYTYAPTAALTTSDTTITISYSEGGVTQTCTQTIAVNAVTPPAPVKLTGISVKNAPTKVTYNEGDNFDKTGMVIEATYSDSTKKDVTTYTVTDGNNLAAGKSTVTISYTEGGVTKTCTQAITVNAVTPPAPVKLTGISVKNAPTKVTYNEGDNFDKTGMVIEATYSDSTKKDVTTYTVTDGNNLAAGKSTVTISYTEGGVTKTCTQAITVNAAPPAPTEYTITFDVNGGIGTIPSQTTSGQKLSSLPTATRSGSYSFDGWYTSGGTQITTAYVFSANTTVYAHWTYTGGSVGVGSYTPSYTVSVDKTENGTITVSPKSASKGSIVTITVKPDKGYTLETLRALDMSGYAMELTENNGRFTFKMPASAVIVKATFMDDNTMLNFFVDVKASDYFYDAVLWAAEKGVTSGADALHFSPNAPCTRAQIVTFLWRAAGSPAPKNMSSFADVPADAFYAKAVAWAVENGITGGTGDGKFSPDATCTRAQAVTFLYRASGAPAVSGNAAFSDVATNAYYAAAVKWAEKKGITGGIGGGLFGSNNNCTRAQIVTFLYRSVK